MVKKVKDTSTEEKILTAAQKVFIAKGMDGARMQDIANEAGINKALLHYYFRSKENLFEVILKQTAGQIFPHFEMVLASDTDFFDKIKQIINIYIDMGSLNPYPPLFILNEMNKSSEASKIVKTFFKDRPPVFFQKYIEEFEKNIKKGIVKKVKPEQVLINIVSMCMFPFIAKPVLNILLKANEQEFKELMQERKKIITDFVINSIKK